MTNSSTEFAIVYNLSVGEEFPFQGQEQKKFPLIDPNFLSRQLALSSKQTV